MLSFLSCGGDEANDNNLKIDTGSKQDMGAQQDTAADSVISFQRVCTFKAHATVTYTIEDQRINYSYGKLSTYDINRKAYIENERYVGQRSSNEYYAIFFKGITTTEITLIKLKVESIQAGLDMEFPAPKFTKGRVKWNTCTTKTM